MKQRSHSLLGFSLFFLALAVTPFFLQSLGTEGGGRYELGVLNDIGIYTILALSLNIILGNCGIFNMGHAAFFAVGAYTTGVLSTIGIPDFLSPLPVFMTMPLAGMFTGLFAFIIARPIIHLRGDYLLVVTIGIVEIVRIAIVNDLFGITGGSSGIYGIPRPELFGIRIMSPIQFFYLIWGFAALTVILFILLENSRFGRALQYIKEDDLAAAGSGIDVAKYKVMAFTLGAFWAGMAGTLFATKMRTISPDAFTFSESVLLFAIVILGGAGSIPGAILGSFLLVGLPELFREFASARLLFYGAAMVLMMLFRPQGLLRPLLRKYDAEKFIGKFPLAKNIEKQNTPQDMLHDVAQEKSLAKKSSSPLTGEQS